MTPAEKNKIVHEKIMGLCSHLKVIDIRFGQSQPSDFHECCGRNKMSCQPPPGYYYSIADAFLLVEKLREIGYRFIFKLGDDHIWCASFTKKTYRYSAYSVENPSAAIVDAALKAIGEEI